MPVNGVPLLSRWIDTLSAVGFREAYINTHFHADIVEKFISELKCKLAVHTLPEGELLGTAGTLRKNQHLFSRWVTLLVHADNFSDFDLGEFISYHLESRPLDCPITMMTFETHTPQSCGIVSTDERGVVTNFFEKVDDPPSSLANGAVYLLEPEVVSWLIENPDISDFSTEVIPHYIGRIATWHNSGTHIDIGTVDSLRRAQRLPTLNSDLGISGQQHSVIKDSSEFKSICDFLSREGP
jgi:mannose-1-phosphate guanylyltransferase